MRSGKKTEKYLGLTHMLYSALAREVISNP